MPVEWKEGTEEEHFQGFDPDLQHSGAGAVVEEEDDVVSAS